VFCEVWANLGKFPRMISIFPILQYRIFVYSLRSEYGVISGQILHISDLLTDLYLFVLIQI